MKWIKAGERLPEDCWQGKFRNINDNSLKEYKGMHELDKGRFSTGSFVIPSRLVEWLDESPISSNESGKYWGTESFHYDENGKILPEPEFIKNNPEAQALSSNDEDELRKIWGNIFDEAHRRNYYTFIVEQMTKFHITKKP